MSRTKKDPSVEFQMLDLELIEANPWNPNQMDQEDLDRLTREIKDVGFIDPIQVVPVKDGRFRLIGGEHRVTAARELKLAEAPAMVLKGPKWKDEDLQKLVTVRLNVLKGKLDPAKMAMLYKEMAKHYGEEALQDLFAFTDRSAWDRLVKQIKDGLGKAKVPKKNRDQFDKEAKEAKTLGDLEKILQKMWTDYGDTAHQSFMVFTFGKREHFYIAMNKETRDALKAVGEHCKGTGEDINEVLGPAIVALASVLSKERAEEGVAEPEEDAVDF
jgi:ParB/RepB/Spo0J family partition protein